MRSLFAPIKRRRSAERSFVRAHKTSKMSDSAELRARIIELESEVVELRYKKYEQFLPDFDDFILILQHLSCSFQRNQ